MYIWSPKSELPVYRSSFRMLTVSSSFIVKVKAAEITASGRSSTGIVVQVLRLFPYRSISFGLYYALSKSNCHTR